MPTKKEQKLQSELDAATARIAQLEGDVYTARNEKIEVEHKLRIANINVNFLTDEIRLMRESNHTEVSVHRDVIELLLNHRQYKERRIDWTNDRGAPIEVQMPQSASQSVMNMMNKVQETKAKLP